MQSDLMQFDYRFRMIHILRRQTRANLRIFDLKNPIFDQNSCGFRMRLYLSNRLQFGVIV